jgi:hypothetical protein
MVALWTTGPNVFSQTIQRTLVETTTCDIANNPAQFIGKLVRVRAQIWPDLGNQEESLETGIKLPPSIREHSPRGI